MDIYIYIYIHYYVYMCKAGALAILAVLTADFAGFGWGIWFVWWATFLPVRTSAPPCAAWKPWSPKVASQAPRRDITSNDCSVVSHRGKRHDGFHGSVPQLSPTLSLAKAYSRCSRFPFLPFAASRFAKCEVDTISHDFVARSFGKLKLLVLCSTRKTSYIWGFHTTA